MIQDYTIAGGSAPTSAPYIHKAFHPKTITVFLDAGVSGKNRAAHAVALAQRWMRTSSACTWSSPVRRCIRATVTQSVKARSGK
jgi:hypothetical protein